MSITVKPKISLNFSEGFAGKEGSVTKNTCPDIMQHDDASWAIPKSLRRGTLQPSSTGQKAQPAPRRPGERPFDLCFLWYPISGQTHTVCELLTFYSVVGLLAEWYTKMFQNFICVVIVAENSLIIHGAGIRINICLQTGFKGLYL